MFVFSGKARCCGDTFTNVLFTLTNHRPSVLIHCWLGQLTRKTVSEMTYNVLSGTLNSTIPYHTFTLLLVKNKQKLKQRRCFFGTHCILLSILGIRSRVLAVTLSCAI